MAISQAQEGVFRPGAMPALGGYLELGSVAFGVRLRAGVLRDGPAPSGNVRDPSLGGLATAALAVRGQWFGAWVELAGGGGVTGQDLVPAFEVGAGWHRRAGAIEWGPSVRYLRVMAQSDMEAFGTAELALLGVDVRFGRRPAAATRPRPVQVAQAKSPPPPPPPPEEVSEVLESDGDMLWDRDASCAQAMEACLALREVTVLDDRLILDERVLFDLGRARVRSKGRRVIRQIAQLWREHPEWQRLRVEGHTCDLGDPEANRTLSQRRAEQVRRVLLRRGLASQRVQAVGIGSERPLVDEPSDAARQRNRRVEFVIERGEPEDGPRVEARPANKRRTRRRQEEIELEQQP